MGQLHCTCVDTINSIKKEDWNDFFGSRPEGYWFYETLEQSRLSEFSFHYLLAYRQQHLIAILPFFTADFSADTVLEPRAKKLVRAVRAFVPRFLVFKTLFCGAPFGAQGMIGVSSLESNPKELMQALMEELKNFARLRGAALIIFKDFSSSAAPRLDRLTAQGFFRAESFPSAVLDLPYADFDQYLASLSHASRKDLRRKLKKAREKGGLEVKIASAVDDCIEEVYRLYMNTYTAGETKFEKLTREFFLKAAEKAGPRCKYFLYYIQGKLAAFNLCFLEGDMLIDKFIGFEYALAREFSLYFVSWCVNVQWCIENGIAHYRVGQTDYAPKEHLGCRLEPLHAYVRHTNALVNRFLRVLAGFLNT